MHTVEKDGYLIDPETGEVLGHADLVEEPDQPFRVVDRESAEWVLARIMDAEAEARAVEERIAAITRNLGGLLSAQLNRKKWLEQRFGGELQAYAEAELTGCKERTVTLAYGRLSFRKAAGSIKVADKERAIEWATLHAPEAVKVEVTQSILVTPLKGREDELPAGIFEVTPPRDTFKIDTGIGG